MMLYPELKIYKFPDYYVDYYSELSKETYDIFEKAAEAKSSLVDSSGIIEPKIAFDLADRVAKMHDIDIAEPIKKTTKISWKRTLSINPFKTHCIRRIFSTKLYFGGKTRSCSPSWACNSHRRRYNCPFARNF